MDPAQGSLPRQPSDLSDVSSYDASVANEPPSVKRPAQAGDDGDDLGDDAQQADFITGVWGVLYTVSREKQIPFAQVTFKLVLDCLQMLLLTINPVYGWNINADAAWWKVVSFVQLNSFMSERGLTFFLACLYTFVFLLIMTAVLCVWVAYAFKNNRFDYVWPITFLRWFSNLFFQILDIASMTLFLMVVDCQYTASSPELRYYNQEFPEVYCWSMPYLIHVVVSSMSVLLFVVMATLVQMGDMETNPTTKYPLAVGHSMVEVIGFVVKFFMTGCSVFVTNLKWLGICYAVSAFLLVYLYMKWVPHYLSWVNIIRVGTYGAVFYSSVVLCVMTWQTGVDDTDPIAVKTFNNRCTIALVAGLIPAALVSALGAHLRLRHLMHTVVDKFRCATPDLDINLVHQFTDPREVEVCARCLRTWLPAERGGMKLDKEEVDLAETIIRVGVFQFKDDAYIHILQAGFLVDVRKSLQSSTIEISAAKKSRPNFLERFAIFSLEQQQTQLDCNNGSDLVSYVQLQRNLRVANKVFKDSLVAMSTFWQVLLKHEVQLEELIHCVRNLHTKVKVADKAYKDLFQSNVDSWRILKVYAQYLAVIKTDPLGAAKWNMDAEEMCRTEEAGQTDMFGEGTAGMEASEEERSDGEKHKAAFDDQNCAIIINSFGVITMANKAAFKLLGCKLSDLMGKNIKILMPSPFREQHDQFIKNYVETGQPKILDKTVELVARHFNGHLFPVSVSITKISGSGMDSSFMGVMQAMPDANSARAWLLADGTMLSCGYRISDWFGHQLDELRGKPITYLVKEDNRMGEMIKLVVKDMAVGRTAGSNEKSYRSLENVLVVHKYQHEPIPCNIDLHCGGSKNQNFIVFDIQRRVPTLPMLVTDSSGSVVHACDAASACLGMPVKQLVSECNIQSLIPEPFALLHTSYLSRHLDLDGVPPAYSCRSGLTLSLNVQGPQGPEPQTFSISVRKRMQVEEGTMLNVITLTPRTVQEVMSERCMAILVDMNGKVCKVSSGQHQLFGFDAEEIMDKPLSSFLDVMLDADQGRDSAQQDESRHIADVMRALASRSVKRPGCSYRVGIWQPDDGQLEGGDDFEEGIISYLRNAVKIPAVMKALLHSSKEKVSRMQAAANPSSSAPFFSSEDIPSSHKGQMMVELQLWKADALTGIINLDDEGVITSVNMTPFCPTDLLLGVGGQELVRSHISRLLPLHGRPAADLFEPLNAADDMGVTRKKGGIKSTDPHGARKLPGVINVLSMMHGTDGQELVLKVQAVPVRGPRGSMALIMHLERPAMGIRNFKTFLECLDPVAMPLRASPSLLSSRRTGSPKSVQPLSSFVSQGGITAPSVVNRKKKRVSVTESGDVPQAGQLLLPHMAPQPEAPALEMKASDLVAPAQLDDDDDDDASVQQTARVSVLPEEGTALPLAHKATPGHVSPGKSDTVAWLQSHTGRTDVLTPSRRSPDDFGLSETLDVYSRSSAVPAHAPTDALYDEIADGNVSLADDSEAAVGRVSDNSSNEAANMSDYKRGKRFKRLSRILSGKAALKLINAFCFKAIATAIAITGITVACFIVAETLILGQSEMVVSMQEMGFAADSMALVATEINYIVLLHENNTAPWLDGLQSFDDVQGHLEKLGVQIHKFKALHEKAFVTMRGLPEDGSAALRSLHNLWEIATIPVTTIVPSQPTSSTQSVNTTLWDAGQSVITRATNVWLNTNDFKRAVFPNTTYSQWYDVRFVLDNVQTSLIPAYTKSMEAFMQVVLDKAIEVNAIHWYFLAVEGLICSSLALIIMLVITTQVTLYRWNIYNIFIIIPMTIIRSIATRLVLMIDGFHQDVKEHYGGDGQAHPQQAADTSPGNTVKEPTAREEGPAINFANNGRLAVQDVSILGILKSSCSMLKCWGASRKVHPSSNQRRRTLTRSFRSIAWFMWPFAVWGLMMVLINAIAHTQLEAVKSPIALFNLINYNLVQFYKLHVFLQMMNIERAPMKMPGYRRTLCEAVPGMLSDYDAMLYGGAAVADTSPLVELVTNGIADTDFGRVLMFSTTDCLREDLSTCLPPENRLYGYTHNGLDVLFNQLTSILNTILTSGGLAPTFTSLTFEFIDMTYPDIAGGLNQLGISYYRNVIDVYNGVLRTHIVGLAITVALMVFFIFVIVLPYVHTCKVEGKCIADLLTQLPYDIDVESMVRKASVSGGTNMETGDLVSAAARTKSSTSDTGALPRSKTGKMWSPTGAVSA